MHNGTDWSIKWEIFFYRIDHAQNASNFSCRREHQYFTALIVLKKDILSHLSSLHRPYRGAPKGENDYFEGRTSLRKLEEEVYLRHTEFPAIR